MESIAMQQGLQAAVDSLQMGSATVTLSKESDFVPGMGEFPPAITWAFHDSTFMGDLSPVYETSQGFVVFELQSLAAESYLPFVDAEPSLQRRLLLEKKIETAGWRANELADQLRTGATIESAAAELGLSVQTSSLFSRLDFVPGLGQNNAVIGTAFGLKRNETAGPIESDGQIFFIELTTRVPASRQAFDAGKESLRAQLSLQREQTAIEAWLQDLRELAEIEDYRDQVFVPRS
jgi:hypothetical protein